YFDRALPVLQQAEKVAMQFNVLLGRARANAMLGRRKEAQADLATALPLGARQGSPKREAQYHEAAAEVAARLGDFEKAFKEQSELREAEKRVAAADNARLAAEQQARFDTKQRETE